MSTTTTANRRGYQNIENTGFGANSNAEGGRLMNRDGTFNLSKTGKRFWKKISLYHTLLQMPRWKFLGAIFAFYTMVNLIFASIYYSLGVKHLEGSTTEVQQMGQFLTAFFFSSQTLTTVGYGHISPNGFWANVIASLESFMGILSFAMVTGVLYGRFTRPKAYIEFSNSLLIAPYKEGKALMLRMATYKNNFLTDAEANITLAMHVLENEKRVTRFYPLKLEISKINTLSLNWTLVHAITEDSPLYLVTEQDIYDSRIELIVNVKAFDDHFSNIVQQKTSYNHTQVVYGAKFLPMYRRSDDGSQTVLELDKIDSVERVEFV